MSGLFGQALAEATAGMTAGKRKGRAWSTAEVETFWAGVYNAHQNLVNGKAAVAAFIFASGTLPGRSLYSVLWMCRKDHSASI